MKLFLLALSLFVLGWSAEVDIKLYESDGQEAYYQEIEKQINSAEHSALYSESTLQEERLQLTRLRRAAAQTVKIEAVDLKTLSTADITPDTLYSIVNAEALLQIKVQQNDLVLRDMQSKLTYLKQRIEHITEEEKPQLLSYQLQFAYYKLQQKHIQTKEDLLKRHSEEIMPALYSALPSLNCSTLMTIENKIVRIDEIIGQLEQEHVALELDREKALIEESSDIDQIDKRITASQAKYQNSLTEKITLQMQQSLCLLHERRNGDFFKLIKSVETAALETPKEKRSLYAMQIKILNELAKETFGTTKTFFTAGWQESTKALSTFKDYLTSPLFVFNEQPISIISLFKAITLVVLGLILGLFYKRWILRLAKRWPDMSQMSIRLASNIGYYLIIIIAVINAIGSVGIDMSSISLIAGALSIGIGFGLQTVVSNFIAGVILMFERTIRIGDTIEISDQLRGRVTDMRIRSTTVKTFDNIDIVVPNSSFIQNNVINWTLEDITRRLHIPFGVAYGTEVEKVKRVILDELAQSNLTYINSDKEKHPEVWMISMNSSSVDFELLVWVEWTSKLRPNSLRSDFLILIYNALYKHGIQIPFPQLDLYVKQLPDGTTK